MGGVMDAVGSIGAEWYIALVVKKAELKLGADEGGECGIDVGFCEQTGFDSF